MASGSQFRPTLSASGPCYRCFQPHLRRRRVLHSLPIYRSLHQSSFNAAEAAAEASSSSAPQMKRVYNLPRTTIYEHTRPQPRAPHRTRRPAPEFRVNDSQEVLDAMYQRLFGRGPEGVRLLPEDLRWQAVTHLSFDHGRQPFNNKLAFMGRRILFFHANLQLINQTPMSAKEPVSGTEESIPSDSDPGIKTITTDTGATYLVPAPFQHPAYKNIDGATYEAVGELTSEGHLADYARAAGIPRVMRWKPMNPLNMVQSGEVSVAIECLYAIIGALALTNGGHEAGGFVRRILASRNLQQ